MRNQRSRRGTRPARWNLPGSRPASILAIAFLVWIAPTATAGEPKEAPTASTALRDAGLSFEAALLLPDADRREALETLERTLGGVEDKEETDEARAAVRYLAAEIRHQLGNLRGAAEGFTRAAEKDSKTPYADDAGFAAIQAREAAGEDAEAAAAWQEWERRHPQSALVGEARLAQAWNALRRGDPKTAHQILTGLTGSRPWYEADPRVALGKAAALHALGKSADALAALGPKPASAPAIYLRALCHRTLGSLLKAAASYQEVVDRFPDSPLRDPALLAKADAFLSARDYRSAAEEFTRAAERVQDEGIRAEAELRGAGAVFLSGRADSALGLLRGISERRSGTDVAARAQFLVGEILLTQGKHAEAIVELNRVLTSYFEHAVAASAQYRIARALDALGRRLDATGTYQAVVSGYPLEPEAPSAAYLAGVGLLAQNRPLAAAPYFQIVLDRYAVRADSAGKVVFPSPERQEIVDAALCLLELSYHRAGNLGQLAGAPHLLLQRMPPSRSPWRAYALLIDADAAAAQARYPEAQATLERLTRDFPDHAVGASAMKLLAWTYARQGLDSLAIATEERLVARYGAAGDPALVSGALLDIAHDRFNQKRYREAAAAYQDFLKRFPSHPKRLMARDQAGLCYVRLDRFGDAVDQWEAVVRDSATSPLAERAWARAGDLYFQAQRYADAKRSYTGLLEHFASSDGAALAMLRLAQCEYNAGHDAAALEKFSETIARFPGTPMAREASRGTELALYRLGQSASGTQVLSQLVERYPTSAFAADAQFQIGKRHYQEKHYAEAAEAFRRVVSRFPGYSAADQAQFLLADALGLTGAREESRLAYEQFLSFFPQSELRSTVQFRLGLQQFEAKDYFRAAMSFTSVLEESAATDVRTASRYNLALCQRLIGQPEEARATLERYRADHPGDGRAADIAYQLGDLHEAAGRTHEALAEFETALDSKPGGALSIELLYRVGRCKEQEGDADAALRAYQRAVAAPNKRDPFRLSALARCAALYEAKRDYGKALNAYRDIAQNSKDSELAAAAAGRASQLQAGVKKR